MELFTNNASSTLNGSITSSQTTLMVASAASFPSTGNFRILIDQELMLVTAVGGVTFTVTRGIESTTAGAHSSGVTVNHIITAVGLTQGIQDHAPLHYPQYGNLTTDVSVGSDPTFTNLGSSVSASGTTFLVIGIASGLSAGTLTPRLQVTVDGSTVSYLTNYGAPAQTTTGLQILTIGVVSGLTSGSHTFQLLGSYSGGGGWTVHASSNPTRESAWLVVIPLGSS
jgi:hypothetical protein